MTLFPLGRHVEHDERSRAFAFQSTLTPRTVAWISDAPVLDQGRLGSCCGNALAGWLNVSTNQAARHTTTDLTEADAVQLYSVATRFDRIPGGYPPDDTGSSGLAVCKAGKMLGYLSAYHHVFGFAAFLSAMQHGPVIVGTDWYDRMFTPDPDGVLHVAGDVVGGHEYLIIGCDLENKVVTVLNSWGAEWGVKGRAYLGFDDFRRLLAAQGDCTVPII